MKSKICVSKKYGSVIIIIITITIISVIASTKLLQTKTSYQSKAAQEATPKPKDKRNASNNKSVWELAKEGRWPFMIVRITNKKGDNVGICNGVAIGNYWILTAAACTPSTDGSLKTDDWEIVYGSNNLNSPTILRTTITYSKKDPTNTIALMRLATIAEKDTVALNVYGYLYSEGMPAVLLGWGNSSQMLKQAVVPFLSTKRLQAWGLSLPITHLAAGYPNGGAFACSGNLGGPLLVWNQQKWLLAGIITSEPLCNTADKHTFTYAINLNTSIKNWIENTVNKYNDDYLLNRNEYGIQGTFIGTNLEYDSNNDATEKYVYEKRKCGDEWVEVISSTSFTKPASLCP